jgi:hypothetical protein
VRSPHRCVDLRFERGAGTAVRTSANAPEMVGYDVGAASIRDASPVGEGAGIVICAG